MPEITLGKLNFTPAQNNPDLLARVTQTALQLEPLSLRANDVLVTPIDPTLADTAEFCNFYEVGLDVSANSIVVKAKRGERRWFALCIILATTRADINGVVRKHLDAKGASFAPMDEATEITQMEYGGIGPIGIPEDWPILIDSRVEQCETAIIGSGIRGSKVCVSGKFLSELPHATVIENMANTVEA